MSTNQGIPRERGVTVLPGSVWARSHAPGSGPGPPARFQKPAARKGKVRKEIRTLGWLARRLEPSEGGKVPKSQKGFQMKEIRLDHVDTTKPSNNEMQGRGFSAQTAGSTEWWW